MRHASAGLKLPLLDCFTADDSANDFHVLDFVDWNRVQVFRQDNIVGEFARTDRALDLFLVGVICAVDGVDPEGFVERDSLVRTPCFTIPTGACNHTLNRQAWIERSGGEVRTRGSVYACIEKRSEGHRGVSSGLRHKNSILSEL